MQYGGLEVQNRGNKQALILAKRIKRPFAAQEMLVLLTQLAHNVAMLPTKLATASAMSITTSSAITSNASSATYSASWDSSIWTPACESCQQYYTGQPLAAFTSTPGQM